MFLKTILTGIAGLSLACTAVAGQQEAPNVLVLKIIEAESVLQQEEAYLIPLKLERLPLDQEGNLDVEALADQTEGMEDGAEWIALDSTSFDETKVPGAIQQEFLAGEELAQDGAQQDGMRPMQSDLNWRVWTPWGTIGNSGYYGYGYRPGYGYNNRYRYNYPRYGYYDGYRNYRYQPSWYNRYRGGYNNRYYYRPANKKH